MNVFDIKKNNILYKIQTSGIKYSIWNNIINCTKTMFSTSNFMKSLLLIFFALFI